MQLEKRLYSGICQRKNVPHYYHLWKHDQCPFSSTVDQNQQRVQIALIFQAMSMDLSASASFVCRNPTNMPAMMIGDECNCHNKQNPEQSN